MMHSRIIAALIALSAALPAAAHRVNIFAWTEGDAVVTESKFSSGQRVSGGTVTVTDAATGRELASGKTAQNGRWQFSPTPEMLALEKGLVLRINAGEGHQNTWEMAREDLPGGVPAPASAARSDPAAASGAAPAPGASRPEGSSLTKADIDKIERIVDRVVEKRLSPVHRTLALATDRTPTVQDIVGGIGWLIGLAGIAAYFRRRK